MIIKSKKDNTEDKVLVQSVKNGDQEAFKKLYYKYYESLFRFAWFRTQSTESARDLIQEIFTRIWLNRGKLDYNKSIKAYLYKSISNLIIDSYRLFSSKSESLSDPIQNKKTSSSGDIDLGIDLKNAIDNLPEKLKTVYTLSRFDGFKYSEIAEICEISVKTVEKRMNQVFNILRKTFPVKYFNR